MEKDAVSAAVIMIQLEIDALSPNSLLDPIRASLFKQLAAAQKKATDRRTPTQKLVHAEKWLKREQRLVEWDKAKLVELAKGIDERQVRIDKEIEYIAGLRAEVGAEPEAAAQEVKDVKMTTELTEMQTELVRLEAKEPALRRKRWGVDLTEAERAAMDMQAAQLLEQAGQKRRKMEHDVEAAAASA